jgi:hypothetical protein
MWFFIDESFSIVDAGAEEALAGDGHALGGRGDAEGR